MFEKVKNWFKEFFDKCKEKWSTIKIVLIVVAIGIVVDLIFLHDLTPRIIILGGVS